VCLGKFAQTLKAPCVTAFLELRENTLRNKNLRQLLDRLWPLVAISFLTVSCDGETEPVDRNETSKPVVEEEKPAEEVTDPDQEPEKKSTAEILAESEDHYLKQVDPAMKSNCNSCHAEPRFKPNPQAPLSIFSFTAMRKLLKDGEDPINNAFINKVRNIVDHTGGNKCSSDLKSEPCSIFIKWAEIEYDTLAIYPEDIPKVAAQLSSVTPLGDVYGYAAHSADSSEKLTVRFYIDGDENSGIELSSVVASNPGFSGGIPGGHLFKISVPDLHRDGTSKMLYAYTTIDGESVELKNSPITFTSWLPKGSGAFYDGNVGNSFTQCANCHNNRSYSDFSKLIDPSPAAGGTATNNILYQRAHNQGHSGANCNATCEQFLQDWWVDEFGG